MKPRVSKFVSLYIAGGCKNATEAAIGAGYSKRSAYSQAGRLMKKAEVQAAISEALTELRKKCLVDGERTIREIVSVALSDIGQAFDEKGNLLPLKDIPDEARRSIASIEILSSPSIINKEGEADAEAATVTKIRLWDKNTALTNLGKHFRLFVDRVEVSDVTDRAKLVQEARERVAEEIRKNADTPKQP